MPNNSEDKSSKSGSFESGAIGENVHDFGPMDNQATEDFIKTFIFDENIDGILLVRPQTNAWLIKVRPK